MALPIQPESDNVRDYLLGKLDASAADEFESRLFAEFPEDELLRDVQACEHELADAFVDGELSPGDLQRFQERYRHSAALRRIVAQRRTLDAALGRRRRNAHATRPVWFRFSTLLPALSAAGACVAVVFLTVHHPRKPPYNAPAVAQQSDPAATPKAAAATPPSPTFFLSNLVTRGPAKPPVLEISPAATQIQLQIELPENAPGESGWQVELTGHSRSYQSLTDLHPEHAGPLTFLRCPIAVAALPDATYEVKVTTLNGQTPAFVRAFRLKRMLK